ncbi:hypothetical protein QBC43DRAFT_211966 [Cladorrhinum sp. PSN259]|nr:hypothetical protein QBC43DRAFT_211966 [Cladorrhinum sp. PSN259]
MMELYEKMLGRSEGSKRHRKSEAAMYFQFVLDHGGRQLSYKLPRRGTLDRRGTLEILIPFYERYHGKTQSNDLRSTLEIIRQRVNFLCAGMVTIYETGLPRNDNLDFFHRTARDFFHEPSGIEILRHSELTELETYCLFVDAVIRKGHPYWRYETLTAHEIGEMIGWLHKMKQSTGADKLQFLRHIDEAMRRSYAEKYGVANGNWVYEQAKLDTGDDGVLDFVSLAFTAGSTDLLSHFLSTKRSFSGRYKDYLLLCSSRNSIIPEWRVKLLALGANPNASFYSGLQDRLRTSPWLHYLVSTRKFSKTDASDEIDTICAFLDNGASLDDRTILLKRFEFTFLRKINFRTLPPRSKVDIYAGIFFVIEVNAKYLLEQQCCWGTVRFSGRRTAVLSRPDVQKVQSHRKVLLVHPGYSKEDLYRAGLSEDSEKSLHEPSITELEPEQEHSTDTCDSNTADSLRKLHPIPYAEIDFLDSEMLLEGLDLVPHDQIRIPRDIFRRKEKEALDMWQRSSKVQDVREYLEDKGYYKNADDLAVLQRPIPLFEDEE